MAANGIPKVGVYVCDCGSNIAGTVDVKAVVESASALPGVVVAREYKYVCSEPGQQLIQQDIKEQKLERVVVASCSPRMHEPTFQAAVAKAGLNPFYFAMVLLQEELFSRTDPVTRAALVVGGGIAGIQSALTIADAGYKVYLVERQPSIGGHMAQLDKTFPTLDCST